MSDTTAPRAKGTAGSVACKECDSPLELVAQADGSVAQERCDSCYPATEKASVVAKSEPEFAPRAKGLIDTYKEEE